MSTPTSRFSFGDVWYSYDLRSVQPSLSAMGVVTLSGHLASGLYAAHAAATAASAVAASFTGTSTKTMNDPPSGTSRIVAAPRTAIDQPAGATNVFPAVVVFGESEVMRSGAEAAQHALPRPTGTATRTAKSVRRRMVVLRVRGGTMLRSDPAARLHLAGCPLYGDFTCGGPVARASLTRPDTVFPGGAAR